MIFHKNDLLNAVLDKHFDTWEHTLNKADYVPKKYLKHIDKVIFDNLKKKLKEVEIYNLLYLQTQGYCLGFFDKLKIFFSGLKPLYENEQQKQVTEQQQNTNVNPELKNKTN